MVRDPWGKIDTAGARQGEDRAPEAHHLFHHSMDVAAVFWRLSVQPTLNERLASAAGRELTATDRARLAALAFLHDVGKLHPGFQAKAWPAGIWTRPTTDHVRAGRAFFDMACKHRDQPLRGRLEQLAKNWGDGAVHDLLLASLAHHGRPTRSQGDVYLGDWPQLDAYDWQAQTRHLDAVLARWFPAAFEANQSSLPHRAPFVHLFAGFVSLADWIGSDTRFFAPWVAGRDDHYDRTAHARAETAVTTIGLDPARWAADAATDFATVAALTTPRKAQTTIGNVPTGERLVVLEAETGSGKTEAALWRFAKLFAAGEVGGLYFAVPTRAAARQLHDRVDKAMRRIFGADAPEAVLAIPGMIKAGEAEGSKLPDWQVLWEDRRGSDPARWAAEHATRFLAAPVAVGTVDQTLLAGLQVTHAHLRGSALSRSLLVVDEVHASDTYMIEVLRCLLRGHLDVGGHALLMSATLGSRARSFLMGTSRPDLDTARAAPYPAVWTSAGPNDASDAATRQKEVTVATTSTMATGTAAATAMDAARDGARVLVIRNTVEFAVATWQAVQDAGAGELLLQVAGQPALHHGRFAAEDRAHLDRAVETALDPARESEWGGVIVIGTQTLEQSLDIDADVLITDLCPVDVLLQRIGRLHRHARARPAGFETPRAEVLLPEGGLDRLSASGFENGLGYWETQDGIKGIYRDLAGLELTRRLLAEYPVWRIPAMNRFLVEQATHRERVAALLDEKGEAWRAYDRKTGGAEMADAQIAHHNTLDRTRPFHKLNFPDTDVHIMTRLGEQGAVLTLDPAPIGPFGTPITRLTIPARWSAGIRDDTPVTATPATDGDGVHLTVGNRAFRYQTSGLSERAKNI